MASAAPTKQRMKWALEKLREGSAKSATAKQLFTAFHRMYLDGDVAGMEELLDRHGIYKGVRIFKQDWDNMRLMLAADAPPEPPAPAASSRAVVSLGSTAEEARYWRERYASLRAEYDEEKRTWGIEYKDSCVDDAVLRRDLAAKEEELRKVSALLAESRKANEVLQRERLAWSAAVGRRDGRLAAAADSERDVSWKSSKQPRQWY